MQPDRQDSPKSLVQRGEALNRKLGMLWSRFWAIVIGFAAISLLYWFITGAGDKALGSTIFIIAIGLALLLLARHLWRNQDGLAETLGGGTSPTRRSRSPENR